MWPYLQASFQQRISWVGNNYDRQVTEVHSEAFLEGWLDYLAELGIPEDNPTQFKAAPAPEYPEPPAPYSPIVLPNLDEDEYVNRSEEDEDATNATVVLGNASTNLVEEAGVAIVEASRERTTEEPEEDVVRDLPPEF